MKPTPKRHRQNTGYALGVIAGLACLGVLLLPSQKRLHAPGPMNTGHEETRLKNDPLDITHAALIAAERWQTCLGCHDFHGNHVMKTKARVAEIWPHPQLQAFFAGGPSPYPQTLYHKATDGIRDAH
ncbi:MAG: hypothetical protein ACR2RL_01980 [Gammaproteobacteria bacterium]